MTLWDREDPVEACEIRRHKNGFTAGSPHPYNVIPWTLLTTLYSPPSDVLRGAGRPNVQCGLCKALALIFYERVPPDSRQVMSA